MSLKSCTIDDLTERFESLRKTYIMELKKLDSLLLEISKMRNELYSIREEFVRRGVSIENEDEENID